MIEPLLFDPESELKYRQGTDFFEQGLLWEAIELYENAVFLDPQHYLAWLNMGVAYGQLGKLGKAKYCFEKAETINEKADIDDELLLDNIGMIYLALGDHMKAVSYFRQALTINEDDAQIQQNLLTALSELRSTVEITPQSNKQSKKKI